MDFLLIIMLVGAVALVPWLIGKVTASALGNTVYKGRNQRARELSGRVLRFEVPGVLPKQIVDAVIEEAGFATDKGLKNAVYITGWDDEHVLFEFTNKLNITNESGFTSVLELTRDEAGDGSVGEYAVVEIYEVDGRATGVEEMEQTAETLRKFTKWRFPQTKVLS